MRIVSEDERRRNFASVASYEWAQILATYEQIVNARGSSGNVSRFKSGASGNPNGPIAKVGSPV